MQVRAAAGLAGIQRSKRGGAKKLISASACVFETRMRRTANGITAVLPTKYRRNRVSGNPPGSSRLVRAEWIIQQGPPECKRLIVEVCSLSIAAS